MWRSDPQIAVAVTRRSASVGAWIVGSWTVSQVIFLGRWNTAARTVRPPLAVMGADVPAPRGARLPAAQRRGPSENLSAASEDPRAVRSNSTAEASHCAG